MNYNFYWYPKCSTCRKAKSQLDGQAVQYTSIDIKENPPKAEQLEKWMKQGNFEIKKFFNTSGIVYREMGLKDKVAGFSIEEAAALLATDGMLIKRPLIVNGQGELVQIGYKEDKYKEL